MVQPGYRIASVTLDRRVGRAAFDIAASRLDERQTMLGAQFTDLIGGGGATSWFLDASARLDFGRGWAANASYRRGWTSATGVGALTGTGRLSTDAWSFDIARDNFLRAGDSFALRVMQPLRVRSGGFDLSLPVSYDYSTLTAGYGPGFFNLAPTGREIDLEAAYGLRLLGGSLTTNLFVRKNPGNIAAITPDLGGALRFSVGF